MLGKERDNSAATSCGATSPIQVCASWMPASTDRSASRRSLISSRRVIMSLKGTAPSSRAIETQTLAEPVARTAET